MHQLKKERKKENISKYFLVEQQIFLDKLFVEWDIIAYFEYNDSINGFVYQKTMKIDFK